jgi:tetratricopeptide (TPR) repeat protein
MKKIFLAFGLFAGMTLTSCDLDTLPSTSLGEDIAITTESDLQNAVNGIGYLLSEDRMTYGAEFGIYADLLTNEFKIVDDYGQSSGIAMYTITKNDELPDVAYYYYYKAIANCNKALALSANMDATDEVKNLQGQLYAWRGLLHFDLARLFAHIPTAAADVNAANSGIVLSTEVYEPDYKGSRATLKETYELIISDLTKAMDLMGEGSDNGTGFHNYFSALALRARANLYAGNYAAALDDAKKVIEDGGYELYNQSTYEKAWVQEGSSESIFELLITANYNPQRNSLGYYCDASGYPECALADDGEILTYLLDHPEDIRSKVIKEQEVDGVAGTHFFPAKYPGRDGIYVNNPKIIRLSEVYLIAAEAELKANNNGTAAAEYINAIEENRVNGYEDVATVTLDDVLFEYKKELFAENQIAFAYWRNNKSVTNQVNKEIGSKDDKAIWPIPQREIDYDPSLVQNPGY